MSERAAPLVEVFHSIQGEGRHVGRPMTFVRVAGCPIRCLYCDTPHSYRAEPAARVHRDRGTELEPNPVSGARAAELATAVRAASPYGRTTRPIVSVTGGEPLLYPSFIRDLAAGLQPSHARIHLESAALHPVSLAEVLPVVSHVSADYKLPSTLLRGDHRSEHRRCVQLAAEADVTLDVKVVITPDVTVVEFGEMLARLRPWRFRLLLVIQPVTPVGAVAAAPPPQLVAECARRAGENGFPWRVLPQVHPVLQVP